ncbi:MAG: hypothetical protein HY289_00560 [Planctomycetes bacterium]|nr:hypothetical protein [Planctomycetota bacterium]
MPLIRLEMVRPRVHTCVNRRADDEKAALNWAIKKYKVKRDTVRVIPVDEQEAAVIVELEKNIGQALGQYSVDWEFGRVVGLDLGYPLCIFGKFTDDQIEPVQHLRHLRDLSLRGNLKITDQGIKVVRSLQQLTSLVLDEMQIGDDCATFLQGLVGLRTLYLGKATLKDQDVARRGYFTDAGLRKLRKLNKLCAVSLDYNEITGAGFNTFEELGSIEYLGLTYTPFNDTGMKNLARMHKMTKVGLSYTQVTSKGLASLKGLKKLEELYLDGTKVADDGLRCLRGLSNLTYLRLDETLVTPEAAEKAYQRLVVDL